MTKLIIVIPVYNESENIRETIGRIEAIVSLPHIINIVYDMDEDTTIPVVNELCRDMPHIALVKNKYGSGVLNAIKTGLESTVSEYVVVTMADLSDPPAVINDMYCIAENETSDIVCASRYMRGGKQIGGPFIKGLLSRAAGLTLHYLAGLPIHDATNSFKLYRTSFLQGQKIESTGGFELGIELVVKAYLQGGKISETPSIWTDRTAGKSNFKLSAWLPCYLKWYFYAFNRYKKNIHKFIKTYYGLFFKYSLAGLFCALINWSLFYIINYILHIYYLIAASFAFIASTTINYFLCRLVFQSRGRKKSLEYLFVFAASGIAISIDLTVMYFLVEFAGIPRMFAKTAGTGAAFLFNYISRQFFIFSPKNY
jgi:putative flippase GtrA